MAYRISLECGDSSCLRTKTTPEGYTHDWQVYIKGADGAPIHNYVEKVVFNLHPSFQRPKRVIREPPYIVKESGYGGFHIPIHVHLKNKNEPKKFEVLYNLNLEPAGPAVSHVSHHNEIFLNPSDEFRKKLLKGGATPMSNAQGVSEKSEVKTIPMIGKPKLSGNEMKKHCPPEQKSSGDRTFTDIFGESIKASKVTLEKKLPEKTSNAKAIVPTPEKSDKIDKSIKIKHSPLKDGKKEKSSDERKDKRDKEKEKFKDKSKRASSPSVPKVTHQSSENKRPLSPPSSKKPITPPPASKRPPSPSLKSKEKEVKKTDPEKEKDKEKEKVKEGSKNDDIKSEKSEKESKNERKKEKKKHKEDRDKEKKEKHKDKEREKSKDKDGIKSSEKKIEKAEKTEKEKLPEPKHSKEEKKSPKPIKEVDKLKEDKVSKSEKSEKNEKSEKHKDPKSEKAEKSKHKHKKKDKKERRDESREREKKEKKEKTKSSSDKNNEVANHSAAPAPVPLRTSDIIDRDSSDSAVSGDEELVKSKTPILVKKETPSPLPAAEIPRTMSPPPVPISDIKKEKEKKREKSKSSREDKRRRKRNENKGLDDDLPVKKQRSERDHSSSPLVEPVSSSQSPIAAANLDTLHSKVKHEPDESLLTNEQAASGDSEQVAPDSTNSTLVDTEEPLVFSEDYVTQLKELQQKIMTLQDNQELQRVVQVIAETGQYEITKKTFDFDLCALDRRTVQRLQQFFAS